MKEILRNEYELCELQMHPGEGIYTATSDGRLTLVKSVIDSAPIYWLNLHQMPKSICDQIERIRRDFLWGRGDISSSESRKLHLIAWDKICKPKNYGGLGLVPMRIRNLALLGKWYYKWERERNRSWNKWIREKYGMTNHCSLSECPISSKFSDSMRSIVSVSKDDSFKGKLDKTQFIWTLKNGESIFFWEDVWISEIPLRDMFKRLYKLSLRKAITVQQFFNISHERSLKGSSFWSRSLRSWELEDVESLESIIDKAKRVEGEDFLVWAASKKPYQTCKATELLQGSGSLISWRFIWKLRVPHKIKLFLWKVHLKILPTKRFLVSREIISKDTAKCSFCNCETETENHLFFDCFKSKQLWEFIFAWWQVSSRSFQWESLTNLWKSSKIFPTKSLKSAWRIVVGATMWSIWLARNQAIHEKKIQTVEAMLHIVKGHAMEWCQVNKLIHSKSLFRWRDSPIGAISESESMHFKDLFMRESNLVGFVDGSWKLKSGSILAGKGGLILENNGNAIFSFAAPSHAKCPVDVEWEAFVFLVKEFLQSKWKTQSLIIYTDCRSVVCKFLEITSSPQDAARKEQWDFADVSHIKIRLISSELNFKADRLAKIGANSGIAKRFWVSGVDQQQVAI